jgi:hypothetical protein
LAAAVLAQLADTVAVVLETMRQVAIRRVVAVVVRQSVAVGTISSQRVAVVEQDAVCPDGLESAVRAVDPLDKTAKKPRDFPEIQLFRWARVAESPQVAQAVQWVVAQGRSTRAVTVERATTPVVAVAVGMAVAVEVIR